MSPPEAFQQRDKGTSAPGRFRGAGGARASRNDGESGAVNRNDGPQAPEPHPGAVAFCVAAKAVFTAPILQFRGHRHYEERGLDAALSKFLQVLDRLSGPFLSFGSTMSLTSLACALGLAVALIALRLRRRQRRIRLRGIMRALFPRRITFHASTGIDFSYVIFNTFIFGAMFGWALFSERRGQYTDGAVAS